MANDDAQERREAPAAEACCWADRHAGAVSRATRSRSLSGIEKLSFSKPMTRPVESLHENDFLAGLLAEIFVAPIAEPHRKRPALTVVKHAHLGHTRDPSLIASVGYAVIRKPSSTACLATAHTQRLVASSLSNSSTFVVASALPDFVRRLQRHLDARLPACHDRMLDRDDQLPSGLRDAYRKS